MRVHSPVKLNIVLLFQSIYCQFYAIYLEMIIQTLNTLETEL